MWKTIPQKDKRTWKRLAKQRRTAAEEGWGYGLWEFNGKSKSKSKSKKGGVPVPVGGLGRAPLGCGVQTKTMTLDCVEMPGGQFPCITQTDNLPFPPPVNEGIPYFTNSMGVSSSTETISKDENTHQSVPLSVALSISPHFIDPMNISSDFRLNYNPGEDNIVTPLSSIDGIYTNPSSSPFLEDTQIVFPLSPPLEMGSDEEWDQIRRDYLVEF